MPAGTYISTQMRNLIINRYRSGKSAYKIALELDQSRTSVKNIIKLYNETGSVEVRSRQRGRPPKSIGISPKPTDRDLRILRGIIKAKPNESAAAITAEWKEAISKQLPDETCMRNIENIDCYQDQEDGTPSTTDDVYTDDSSNDNGNNRMSLRDRSTRSGRSRQQVKQSGKSLKLDKDQLKLLQDLYVDRKPKKMSKFAVYDTEGVMRSNGLDLCDCLNDECVGCWTECTCGSTKCGPKCRNNRRFMYEEISYDGKNTVIKNKYFVKK